MYTSIGVLLVGTGLVGVVVPGLPTTIFLILALWCFKRGNERLERWLLEHKRFGPTLRDWEQTRSIRHGTKLAAILILFACVGISILFVKSPYARVGLPVLAILVSIYIWTRPTAPELSARRA